MSLISTVAKNIARETGRAFEDVMDEIARSPRTVRRILQLGGGGGGGGRGATSSRENLPGNDLDVIGDYPMGPMPPAEATEGPSCVDSLGRPLAKVRPWIITSTFRVAAGALAADTSLGDFFNSANSAFFTTTGKYPNPFSNRWISGIQNTQAPAAVTETPGSSIGGSYVVLINQVELARYSFLGPNGWGGMHTVVQPLATSGVAAAPIPAPSPVYWPFYFDSNSTWAAQYRIPDGVTTVAAVDVMLSMAGFLHNTG